MLISNSDVKSDPSSRAPEHFKYLSQEGLFAAITTIMSDRKWRSEIRILDDLKRFGLQTCFCDDRRCIHPNLRLVSDWIKQVLCDGIILNSKTIKKYKYWRMPKMEDVSQEQKQDVAKESE